MMSMKTLAKRNDVAALALLGVIPSSFGAEAAGGARSPYDTTTHDFGNEYGYQAAFGEDYGMDYGYQAAFGADAAAAPHPAAIAPPAPRPNIAQLHAAHAHMVKRNAGTHKRLALLNPNKDSDVDVEAYIFSLNPSQFSNTGGPGGGLVWGTANGWVAFKNPQVAFRAERLFINVKIPGLIYVNTVQAANVNAQIGGVADGFTFSVFAMGSKISLPTLPPQNTMQVTGTWSVVVDTQYTSGTPFMLAIDFEGYATVTPK